MLYRQETQLTAFSISSIRVALRLFYPPSLEHAFNVLACTQVVWFRGPDMKEDPGYIVFFEDVQTDVIALCPNTWVGFFPVPEVHPQGGNEPAIGIVFLSQII